MRSRVQCSTFWLLNSSFILSEIDLHFKNHCHNSFLTVSSFIEIISLVCPLHMLYKGECLPHVLVFSEVSLISKIIFLLLCIFFFLCIFVCLTSNGSHYDTVKLSFLKRGAIQKFLTGVFSPLLLECATCIMGTDQ